MSTSQVKLRTYECSHGGYSSQYTATSAGKARYQHFLELGDVCPDISITEIKVRSLGAIMPDTRVSDYARRYKVPAKVGRRVVMDGRSGRIIGCSDGYLKVLFDDTNTHGHCHPFWRMTYYGDDDTTVLASYVD